ncbi:MAG: cob(I)yrinic acid a,c-diamide adenosyltransferase [Candidatus Melainabacteria bacterium]|nr:cob(I)yrinic acid a,c-diamide adenosyltransferase [Candidatus Melainabacteria bacterium]
MHNLVEQNVLSINENDKQSNKNPIHDSPTKKEKMRLYLGYAPGKTTALNGVALRAIGAGLKVKLILFSKCQETTSESKIYEILKAQFPNYFDYFFAGTSRIRKDGSFRFFGDADGWTLQDQLKLDQGLRQLANDVVSGEYDLLCVDELTDLLYHKEQRVPEKNAKLVFETINPNTMILITGHLCPDWLKEMATTIIEGKVHKHYLGYTRGIEW